MTLASAIPPGAPVPDPDTVGDRYYNLYQQPDLAEGVIGDLEAFRALVTERAGE
ncbi:hypothetical protein ACH4FX_12815 [Streptomyces sp. NPDC018019]|uniref:hypothetical protein n=1 Tax=Streptomyces sp. NPDC018019 TaxID=3365030 RepID=UPI0037BA8365